MAAWRPFVGAATVVLGALDAERKAGFAISHFDHALLLILVRQARRRARQTCLSAFLHVHPLNISCRGLTGEMDGAEPAVEPIEARLVQFPGQHPPPRGGE